MVKANLLDDIILVLLPVIRLVLSFNLLGPYNVEFFLLYPPKISTSVS